MTHLKTGRPPIFFYLAGFLGALLYSRQDTLGFLRNRVKRVLFPFILFWVILFPLVKAGLVFAEGRLRGSPWGALRAYLTSGQLYTQANTLHLWFLQYLLFYYVVVLVVAPLGRRVPARLRHGASQFFRSVMHPTWRLVAFAPVTALALLSQGGIVLSSSSFVPDARVVLTYATFFGFGWALYFHADILPTFRRGSWVQVLAGLLLAVLQCERLMQRQSASPRDWDPAALMASITGAVGVWLLLFGITGLFLRYVDRPIPAIRYLVDASYWIYLVHVPFIFWLAGLLATLQILPVWKLLLILGMTLSMSLGSYHLLVPGTAIGALLTSRGYPPARGK